MGTIDRDQTEADASATEGEPRDFAEGSEASDPPKQDLSEVLASIRQLVTAETAARVDRREQRERAAGLEGVLILTPEMRVDDGVSRQARSGEVLTEGLDEPDVAVHSAPILDEEALRAVINAIIREELQGELGDRISRNLRKLIRREIGVVMAEERERAEA